jgi:ribosomal protein S12 methylthiotransferase
VPSIVDSVLGHAPSEVCPTGESRVFAGGEGKAASNDLGRGLLTPVHSAYLRLGEGCNHICTFCAIPSIRGKLKSKPMEVLIEEAEALASLGARELTLIAEDSTDYAKDLGVGYGLTDLLEGLGGVVGIGWVRVMYAHPATIDEPLVATMARVGNVLPYVDMPIQHGDEAVLRAMRRGTSPDRIRRVVGWLREAMPDVTLRTTVLVGFPGETESAFHHLMEFLEALRFDRVGCFAWSPEESTESYRLESRVAPELAEERRATVMSFQRELMEQSQRLRIGSTEQVLVDAVGDDGALGRTRRDAPEVDGRVLIEAGDRSLKAGTFVEVKMTGVKGYDLVGTLTA